ncbi:MAG: GntR family transcriptional regulator [Candidatus Izemoplasmatales bacterium]
MNLVVAVKSEVPIYEQLHDQVAAQIVNGELAADTALPSIRAVAVELGVSVITIKKAWERLEDEGFIVTWAGKGCYVRGHAGPETDRREEIARKRLATELPYYVQLGIGVEEYLELVRSAYPKR